MPRPSPPLPVAMEQPNYQQPTCETDSDSDGDSGCAVGDASRRSPASANVAAKRSKSSELNAHKPAEAVKEPLPANIDLQSDSGYSSHTAATMSSADSAPSAKSQSPPTAPVNAAPKPPQSPTLRRQPPLQPQPPLDRRQSTQESSRKPLQRSGSVSSRNPRERRPTTTRRETECTKPNCTACPPNVRARDRRSIAGSGVDIYNTYDQPPPSPSHTRQPPPYAQGPAIVQPSATRRRSSSQNRGMRPTSYHGEQAQTYWVNPNPYPSPPQEHGPPLSASARWNMTQQPQPYPYGMVASTPPNAHPGWGPMATSPPYEIPPQTRPSMPNRNTSYSTRPTSMYGAPLVIHDQQPPSTKGPSARYPDPPLSARHPPSQFESESSEEESSEEEYEYDARSRARDHDRAIMPPPALKPRRQSLMSQSQLLPERPRERDSRASRGSNPSTRASSKARSAIRPALVQGQRAQTTYNVNNADAEVFVERNSRRQSYQGYEQRDELERKHRNSQVVYGRRNTDANTRRRDEKVDGQVSDLEAHLSRTRGSEVPLTEQVHKAAKRQSRLQSGHSEAGSSRSKNSDKASRVSQSNRTTVTNGGTGEIRLRVDASAPLSLQFNGDMEGRTLQINPAEGGMAELVIGSARGSETTYSKSERGASVAGSSRRLIANNARRDGDRRDAELESRSSRSTQSRRDRGDDRERRLRRREGIEYS